MKDILAEIQVVLMLGVTTPSLATMARWWPSAQAAPDPCVTYTQPDPDDKHWKHLYSFMHKEGWMVFRWQSNVCWGSQSILPTAIKSHPAWLNICSLRLAQFMWNYGEHQVGWSQTSASSVVEWLTNQLPFRGQPFSSAAFDKLALVFPKSALNSTHPLPPTPSEKWWFPLLQKYYLEDIVLYLLISIQVSSPRLLAAGGESSSITHLYISSTQNRA